MMTEKQIDERASHIEIIKSNTGLLKPGKYTGKQLLALCVFSDGQTFCCSNFEKLTPPGSCAESICIMYAEATRNHLMDRTLVDIYIYNNSLDKKYPCGMCRELIYSANCNCRVHIVNNIFEIDTFTIKDLLLY